MTDRDQLQKMLEHLDADVARQLGDGRDPDAFWPAFATQSSAVLDAAGAEHFDWVSSQIDEMLRRRGIPTPEA